CADQLVALLGPDTAAACENPRSPDVPVVLIPADDGCVTVGGQRDGLALSGGSDRSCADQLADTLLSPNTTAAREDPRSPDVPAVVMPADDGRVAVGGQRDGDALIKDRSNPSRAY